MNWNDQSTLVRGVRPALGWVGIAFAVVITLFLLAVLGLILYALLRWAGGEPVDLNGFAAVMTAATAAGTALWSLFKNYLTTRYGQRVEEIRAGIVQPPVPTIPPSSSLDGGGQSDMPNPHGGGPDAP